MKRENETLQPPPPLIMCMLIFFSVIYFTFIRPIIEYGDVVCDNIPQNLKNDLDKIRNEAARIVTGCSKPVSLDELKTERGWESLGDCRHKHKLILIFKMTKCLAPSYLSDLVPDLNNNLNNYNLLNSNNARTIVCRTNLYKKSCLPSVVEKWNSIPQDIRNLDSLSCFKRYLDINRPYPNKLFFIGQRHLQILHTRFETIVVP